MDDLNKYKFFTDGKSIVVAVSTYEKKKVRGVAKCHPNDVFDFELGKTLAAAKCNKKICDKRLKRARRKEEEAKNSCLEATKVYRKAKKYVDDATVNRITAGHDLLELLEKIKEKNNN